MGEGGILHYAALVHYYPVVSKDALLRVARPAVTAGLVQLLALSFLRYLGIE